MAQKNSYYDDLVQAARDRKHFRMCRVCGSIVSEKESECPYCGAYSFDTDHDRISDSALDQLTDHAGTSVRDPFRYAYD